MKNLNSVVNSIEKTYLENLEDLSPIAKRHFLYRLYLSKPTNNNRNLLVKHGLEPTKVSLKLINELNTSVNELVDKKLSFIETLQPKYPHEEQRFKVWKMYPDLLVLYNCLVECFYLNYFKIPFVVDKKLVENLYSKLIKNKEFIVSSSTQAICIVYYLEYIQMLPRTQTEKWMDIDSMIGCFSISKQSSITEVFNYLYALNHLIICSSYFYLRKPEKQTNNFVEKLEYWTHYYFDQISLDLQVESLLSCYLLGYKPVKIESLVIQNIISNFNDSLGFVDNRKQNNPTLESVEHTNVLCILISRIDEMGGNQKKLSFY